MSRPSARMSPRPIDEVTIRSELIGDAHDAYEAICGSGMTALPESRYSCNSSEGQARWHGTGFDRCPFPLFSSSSLGGRNEGSSRVARGGGIGRAVGLGLCAGTTARLIYAKLLGYQDARHDADAAKTRCRAGLPGTGIYAFARHRLSAAGLPTRPQMERSAGVPRALRE